jgi:hypothetical protein
MAFIDRASPFSFNLCQAAVNMLVWLPILNAATKKKNQ